MIEVLVAGPLTSVQDAFGRPGWRQIGVPVGGAADAWSARLANRLVGNDEGDALLEITLGGFQLRFEMAATAVLVGGMNVSVDRLSVAANAAFSARAGSVIRVHPGAGARGYLAVAGGISVEAILGSRSTDLRSGFGGHDGRALRSGDRLEIGASAGGRQRWTGSRHEGSIRIVPGPHAPRISLDGQWTVGTEADRTGVRLDGRRLEALAEVPSLGLPLGAVQVPPDGRPIVMLADRPVTGGYPVPACVIRADIGRVAQLRSGDRVTFASVSVEEAREALRQSEEELAALEALEVPRDDELGWIGSHE